MPDYQELRTQANALKKHTIENLDYYLEEFERNVQAHGGKVIYCKDATEVADFVLELAKERGAQLIVKSKSMTTEEVDFNERLEHHDLEPVETDLGEYIMQLAHERPYHIVAPALHKTRYDVADLFTEQAGRAARNGHREADHDRARRCCGEKFLAADIGISGANFLVADSGAVVLVENEGNARLTTSAPKIHIAVAGIEKMIPRAQDLAVFLKLLGRSATGQPLTVYTSFLSGPRRAGRDRRSGRVLRGAAGQRPHQAAGGPREAPVALLHPLRRVPEHLPGVSQDRRAQLPVGVLRADRRHHHAAVPGRDARAGAAVRLQPVRRVRGSLPGQDRHSEDPAGTALGGEEGRSARGQGRLERLAFRVWAWVMRHPRIYEMAGMMAAAIGPPEGGGRGCARCRAVHQVPPLRAWLSQRDLPPAPPRSFRQMWRRR